MRMIEALVSRHPAGFTEAQWATMSNLKRTGGTWSTYKSRLRGAGMIDERDGLFFATSEALAAHPDAVMDAAGTLDAWRRAVGRRPAEMLDAIIAAHPYGLTREALAEAVGLEVSGGTFSTYLSRLSGNGLIEKDGDRCRAAEIIMEAVNA